MSIQVSAFRSVLGLVLGVGVVGGAVVGALNGAIIGLGVNPNSIIGAVVVGAVVGAVLGWIVGSYLHGIGFTLLSINDHLASMASNSPSAESITRSESVSSVAKVDAASAVVAEQAGGSWRDRLEALPVDQSMDVKGLLVWKLKDASGKVYYSGDRNYESLEELLKSYGAA
jgi:hypothetical protein